MYIRRLMVGLGSLGLAATAHASNLVQNPDFVGTGGQSGYGQFYPDPTVSSNKHPAYAVSIADWNAPLTSDNASAPFLFAVNPADVITSTGFPDSWDSSHPSLYGPNHGGTLDAGTLLPSGGETTALLLDADYHITPIYQIIPLADLTPGKEYTISFEYAAGQWYDRNGDTTEGLEIGLGGRVVQIASINPKTGVNGAALESHHFSGWSNFTATFLYSGNPTNMTYGVDYGGQTFQAAANWLTFIGEGSPQGEPPTVMITGVSLTQAPDGTPIYQNPGVPEPATWAMTILGFGLLGGVARRRRAPTPARAA
jgi:hypothetical protein